MAKAKIGKTTKTFQRVYRECWVVNNSENVAVTRCATEELANELVAKLTSMSPGSTYTVETGDGLKDFIGRDVMECIDLIGKPMTTYETLVAACCGPDEPVLENPEAPADPAAPVEGDVLNEEPAEAAA